MNPQPAAATAQENQSAPPKSVLPQHRAKSAEEEIRRLANAAAAAGGAHSFRQEDAPLPPDRHRTPLPVRRTLPPPEEEPALNAPEDSVIILPPRSQEKVPPDRSQAIAAAPLLPIDPKPDVEISATPLRGPSRFVRPGIPDLETLHQPEQSNSQTSADAPAPGSAPRGGFRLGGDRQLHYTPVPAGSGDEGEAAAWGASAETPDQAARSRQFISLSLILVLLAIGGAVIYTLRQAFQAPAALSQDFVDPLAPPSENVMGNVQDARRVLDRFLAADTLDKMVAEVRHPDITRPRMEHYYTTNALRARKKRTESAEWSEIRIEDTEFISAAFELDDFRLYPITLEVSPGSDPKVDWESFVNWAEVPWKDFLKSPPEQSLDYRVTLTHELDAQYYNYYSKGRELDLMCFKIEDPDNFGSCWAYCDKDSEAASRILFHLKRARWQGIADSAGHVAISCILRLRFPPEGMKSNQVCIEKFLHDSWVIP